MRNVFESGRTTIQYLMSALQMLNTSGRRQQSLLRVNFRNSLRLLPLQDIIDLYTLCQEKRVFVDGMKGGDKKNLYDWSYAVMVCQEAMVSIVCLLRFGVSRFQSKTEMTFVCRKMHEIAKECRTS